ncbi:amidohydrolase family protein [Egicoccus halophilus]|uniref:2-pyrone-4,6-dicarboxylate hydrolase n=1 Tax=Egicoccus halophilus TaxID=1670830 RepID=A0A8J3AF26_9ACTN|nr:amidohydrolase family protein [Egicoccus halophilus]GGI07566.1 2-pyrone-4,6-dicarboxylate hydrolase [Egicoccus halophilus]
MKPTIPGPHPAPHPPRRFVAPAGACDAHCHIFGPADRFPFAPGRAYTPPDAGLEHFEELQRTLGMRHAVFVQASCHGTDNRAMLDALRRGAGRYAGVAMVDDRVGDQQLQELHAAGVRGARFNFVKHLGGAPDMGVFRRVIERIAPLGWHAVLHLDAKDLLGMGAALQRLPVAFVIDHMARVDASAGVDQPAFVALLELLEDERCWVKISGAERLTGTDGSTRYRDVVPFMVALVDQAPDRVLWGTDWPHPNVRFMPDDGDLVDLLADVLGSERSRQAVLVDNPRRLYPLSG